jgi:hypothetical protein
MTLLVEDDAVGTVPRTQALSCPFRAADERGHR